MSAKAHVTYNFDRGELCFVSTHKHSRDPGVKVVSAAVILFHTSSEDAESESESTRKLHHSADDISPNNSLRPNQGLLRGSNESRTIPASFSLLPVPLPEQKGWPGGIRSDDSSSGRRSYGSDANLSGVDTGGVPTVFDALANVVQQAEDLEKAEAAMQPASCSGEWRGDSPLAPESESPAKSVAELQLTHAEQQRALLTSVGADGAREHLDLQAAQHQEWTGSVQEQEILGEGMNQAMAASEMADSREPNDFEGFCPVIKIEPLSPEGEEPEYSLMEGGLPQPSESQTTLMTVKVDSMEDSQNSELEPNTDRHVHHSLSPQPADAAMSALQPHAEMGPKETAAGSGVEHESIDLTIVKEETHSDDDLQELSVSFASGAEKVVDTTCENTSGTAIRGSELRPEFRERRAASGLGAGPGTGAHGYSRPLSRLGRPPSRLPHRQTFWRHLPPLQHVLKMAKKTAALSSRRGRMAARIGKSSVCGICSAEITCYQDFEHHMTLHHKGELGYTCPVCLKTFKSRTQITYRHSAIHGLRDLYTCPICGIQITRRDSFKRHFTLTHPTDMQVLHRYLQSYVTATKSAQLQSKSNYGSSISGTARSHTMPHSATASSQEVMASMRQRQAAETSWSNSALPQNPITNSCLGAPSALHQSAQRIIQSVTGSASSVISSEHSVSAQGVVCSSCGQSLHHEDIQGMPTGTSSLICRLCREEAKNMHSLEMQFSDRQNLPPHPGADTSGSSSGAPSQRMSGNPRQGAASQSSTCSSAAVFAKPLPPSAVSAMPRLVHRRPYPTAPRTTSAQLASQSALETGSLHLDSDRHALGLSYPPYPTSRSGGAGRQAVYPGTFQGSSVTSTATSGALPGASYGSNVSLPVSASSASQGVSLPSAALEPSQGALTMRRHHRRRTTCSYCQALISTKEEFMLHVEMHGCLLPEPKCPICRQTFRRKTILVRHSTSHLTQKWICKICRKTFARSDSCKRHLRSRHGQPGDGM